MTRNSDRWELILELGRQIQHTKALGFTQTREVLIVALSVLSQEDSIRAKSALRPLHLVRDDDETSDSDWLAKEPAYLKILIDAQHLPATRVD